MSDRTLPATPWPKDELQKITGADDLHVAPFREDGTTYGTPTWIWCVAVDGALYVRAYNGQRSRWYQAAMHQKAGRIFAAGSTREVGFNVPVHSRPQRGPRSTLPAPSGSIRYSVQQSHLA